MTTTPDLQPQASFRLSMLLYDSRYRSMTIQIIALIGFLTLLGWLFSNTASNLADLGKEPSFRFLGEPAGYDINQRLLEYTNRDTHLRAALMGLLNTLLVAVMGCITATILGVVIGVLRLSPNWIVSRLSAVYVEGFRNVPVLLWIVFTMAILIETLPAPRAFKSGEATMSLFDSVALTNRGIYIPEPLFHNTLGNIHLFGASSLRFDISIDLLVLAAVFIGGLFVSSRIKRRADRIQEATGDRPTTWYWRLGVVFVPTIAVLVMLGFHLGYPELKGFNFKGGIYMRNSLIALWLALSLYTAAFIAEIVRAGILAVSKGQTEAASALGLRPNRTMNLVILPQALRVIIPPLISNYLNLTKNSSLAIAVGYMDITGTLGGITMNQTGRELETVLLLMLVYLAISLTISAVMNWYNESVKLKER
ncbi:ABC transporter permease subunit [Aliiroseovarius crassostreae]|uniref:amino acid ABC transporter permease n=1 Tax=Aliiroseovarius crassostreae TaxID=154981 RepID=UPI0021AEE671|nr:ABC transporter permease subunit [Aliiroseovarius crassostreae]UWP92544.1 ABC transporter permease subunit [Aliiroseovarius crassostreae]UWP98855.1 ABC transporter permease subunit [Aliiroseovarius crassostreae]